MNRTEPTVKDFDRIILPVAVRKTIKSTTGVDIPINVVNWGSQPVCKLEMFWYKDCPSSKEQAVSNVMIKSLREGCRGFTGKDIDFRLDFTGAILGLSSTFDYNRLTVYGLKEQIAELFPLIFSIISEPTFPEKRIEDIKHIEADNVRIQQLRVTYWSDRELYKMIMGKENPRALVPDAGDYELVDRDKVLQAFRKEITDVAPEIWVGGKVDDTFIDELSDYVGKLQPKKFIDRPEKDFEVASYCPEKHIHSMATASQCAVGLGCPVKVENVAEYQRLVIAVTALGGFFGSLLNKNIREEKGLTYGIHSSMLRNPECAFFIVKAQTSAENIDLLVEQTKKEIDQLARQPINAELLNAMKQYIMLEIATMVETPLSATDMLILQRLRCLPDNYYTTLQTSVKEATAETILATAAKYLNSDRLSLSIAGNV